MEKNRQHQILLRRRLRWLAILLALSLSLLSLVQGCRSKRALEALEAVLQATAVQSVEAPEPSAVPEKTSLTLSFAGDCTLGTDPIFGYNQTFPNYYDTYGPEYFFEDVRDIFANDDLTVANLEGTLTTSDAREERTWNFKGDPAYAGILTAGAIEAVNVANNHSHDYGPESHTDTLAALDAAGIAHFGYAETWLTERSGVRIGFTGGYDYQAEYAGIRDCEAQITDNIRLLQEQGAELIIVCLHWGVENNPYPYPYQTEMAYRIIDAGADLIIGHHPHVLQGIELYHGKYIVYSLGNFCFGGNGNPPDYDTAIVQLTYPIRAGQITGDPALTLIPCSISSQTGYNTYCPTRATGEEAQRIVDKIYDLSAVLEWGITRNGT